MLKKFGKDRSVISSWLHIPIKYMLEVSGSNTGSKSKYVLTPEYLQSEYSNYVSMCRDFGIQPEGIKEFKEGLEKERFTGEFIPSKHNKEFCIISLSKRVAICAWRNVSSCKIGIPFLCRVERRRSSVGIIYKDKYYPINKSSAGWVY